MRATIEGEVLGSGETMFEGKTYPYFELLQRAEGRMKSEVIQVSGSMEGFGVGDLVMVKGLITVNNAGHIRVKRINSGVK